MSLFRRGDVWWYEFWFAGRRVQESSKSTSKTIARTAEQDRKRELEKGFNNFTDTRHERIRSFSEVATDFYDGYKLRLPDSAVFADYAIGHLKRLLGSKMLVDFNEAVVIKYQNDRLDEGTAPKTINEEVGFLLRILGEPGDILRARLRKRKMLKLKVHTTIGKAYSEEEKQRMLERARKARSPHILFALMLALYGGMRKKEIITLKWPQFNFDEEICPDLAGQNGGWRRADHPPQFASVRGATRICRMVREEVRRDPAGVVCLPVRKTSADRSHAPRNNTENGVGQCAR